MCPQHRSGAVGRCFRAYWPPRSPRNRTFCLAVRPSWRGTHDAEHQTGAVDSHSHGLLTLLARRAPHQSAATLAAPVVPWSRDKQLAPSCAMDNSQSWFQSYLQPLGLMGAPGEIETGGRVLAPQQVKSRVAPPGAPTAARPRPAFNDITNNDVLPKLGGDKASGARFLAFTGQSLVCKHANASWRPAPAGGTSVPCLHTCDDGVGGLRGQRWRRELALCVGTCMRAGQAHDVSSRPPAPEPAARARSAPAQHNSTCAARQRGRGARQRRAAAANLHRPKPHRLGASRCVPRNNACAHAASGCAASLMTPIAADATQTSARATGMMWTPKTWTTPKPARRTRMPSSSTSGKQRCATRELMLVRLLLHRRAHRGGCRLVRRVCGRTCGTTTTADACSLQTQAWHTMAA
jgi:hypothetical protein